MWEGERLARAKALWDEGLSTAAVGRQLGVSKNSIAGLRKREHWEPRKSPIPQLTPQQIADRTAKMQETKRLRGPPLRAMRETAPPRSLPTLPLNRPSTCQWPIGKLFCGAATEPKQSYCLTHCKQAYSRWPPPEYAA